MAPLSEKSLNLREQSVPSFLRQIFDPFRVYMFVQYGKIYSKVMAMGRIRTKDACLVSWVC